MSRETSFFIGGIPYTFPVFQCYLKYITLTYIAALFLKSLEGVVKHVVSLRTVVQVDIVVV